LKLTLLTTPIGNISDASRRLINVLETEKLFFVEDSRQFYKLLELLEISAFGKKVVVFNDHKQSFIDHFIEIAASFDSACVLSDAGSPVLSDPAFPLIKAFIEMKGELESIPGPSAVTMAVELCGFAPIPFSFYGFLPRQKNDLYRLADSLAHHQTFCFFESPHRVEKTLTFWEKSFPEDDIFIGRELTKKFESHYRFKAKDFSTIKSDFTFKGEIVMVVFPNRSQVSERKDLAEYISLAESYLEHKTPKKLAKLLGVILDRETKDIYNELSLK